MSDGGVVLADWRNKDDYPSQGASYAQWAWEFLRRNAEYQSDYARYERMSAAGLLGFSVVRSSNEPIPDLIICEPPSIAGETYADLKDRLGENGKSIVIFSPTEYFRRKYKVDRPVTYKRREVHPGFFSGVLGNCIAGFDDYLFADGRYNSMEVRRKEEVAVRIRLDVPIDAQLGIIKQNIRELDGYNPYDVRLHVRKFMVYLRAHDGVLAGCTAREIADKLSDENIAGTNQVSEKDIENYKNSASKLILDGYWKISVA